MAARKEDRNIREAFANECRTLRISKKIKLRELSLKTGLSTSYLCGILKGKKTPPIDNATKISKALGYNLNSLKRYV